MIHLNNAGASLPTDQTLNTMIDYLRLEQEIGGYEAARKRKDDLQSFYSNAAELVGSSSSSDIAFVDSATRGWNTVLYSIPFRKGDKILTAGMEYGSNIVSLQHVVERHQLQLIRLPVSDSGEINPKDLRAHLDKRTRLVALTHAPAHCGSVINAEEVGHVVRDSSAHFLLDACQTVGQMPIDVTAIGCDALVATGRKWLRGPRGTGFVYANAAFASQLESVALDLANTEWLAGRKDGSHIVAEKSAKRLQLWERSMAAQLALSNAIREAIDGDIASNAARINKLRNLVVAALQGNPKISLYPGGNSRSAVVTFYHRERDASDVMAQLAAAGINTSTMNDWDAPWDFEAKKLPALVRVSAHYYNTEEEISAFADAVRNL